MYDLNDTICVLPVNIWLCLLLAGYWISRAIDCAGIELVKGKPALVALKNRYFKEFLGKKISIQLKRNFQILVLYFSIFFSNFFINIYVIIWRIQAFCRCTTNVIIKQSTNVQVLFGGKDADHSFHPKQENQNKFILSLV